MLYSYISYMYIYSYVSCNHHVKLLVGLSGENNHVEVDVSIRLVDILFLNHLCSVLIISRGRSVLRRAESLP